MRRRTTVFDRFQRRQSRNRLVDRGGGGRVDPAEVSRIADAPECASQHQRGQVRLQDFGRIVAREASGGGLFPQAVRYARPEARGAASALGHRGLARAFRYQPCHAGGAVVPRASGEAGVDDDADAVERQAGLSDASGEHDFPPAVRFGENRGALRCGVEAAVEFVQDNAVGEVGEAIGGPFDLRNAGEEGEHAALRFAECAADRGGDRVLDAEFGLATDVAEGEWVAAAFAFDHGRAVHQCREPRTVERC